MHSSEAKTKLEDLLNFVTQETYKLKPLPPLKRRNYNYWTLNEDEKLIRLAKELNHNWIKISLEFLEKTPEMVEKRWKIRVDPTTKKTPWTSEEDQTILDLHREFGACWKIIANHLTGRLPSAIKNRFYSKLQKIAYTEKSFAKTNPLDEDLSTAAEISDFLSLSTLNPVLGK